MNCEDPVICIQPTRTRRSQTIRKCQYQTTQTASADASVIVKLREGSEVDLVGGRVEVRANTEILAKVLWDRGSQASQ